MPESHKKTHLAKKQYESVAKKKKLVTNAIKKIVGGEPPPIRTTKDR